MAILSAEVFTSDFIATRHTLIVADNNLLILEATSFSEDRFISLAASQFGKEAYQYVRSGQSPQWQGKRACTLMITVFKPIDDIQSKALNNKRAKIGKGFASAVGGVAMISTRNKLVTFGATALAYEYALEKLRAWDAGDILISVEASVSGGIGPQNHQRSLVVKRSAYDPVAETG